jgi:MYXO-CTERM domain-containing protein
VRNADRVGVPVLSTDVGRRLWTGTEPDSADAGAQTEAPAPPEGLDEAGEGVFYLKGAAGRIASAPGRWLGLAARRVGRLWSPAPPEGLEDGPLGPASGYTSLLPTALLALLGVGLLRRRSETWWLLLVPVTATLVHLALAGWAGDRAAVMPPLAALGGAGLAALLGRPEDGNKASAPQNNIAGADGA